MAKEQICYYCKHWSCHGVFGLTHKCDVSGDKTESFDTCRDWEDSNDE